MRIKAKDPKLVALMGEFMRTYLPIVRSRDAVRDRFLLSLLYESGARINEVLSLKLLDIKATSSGEADVHFYGKGKKRIWCFILSAMAREIKCPVIMSAVYLKDARQKSAKVIRN